MTSSKDLFDDSTMTFGEHLECLRGHLIKAIFFLLIAVIACLFFGDRIVAIVRAPIDEALAKMGDEVEVADDLDTSKSPLDAILEFFDLADVGEADPETVETVDESNPLKTGIPGDRTVQVSVLPSELLGLLHATDPETFPRPKPRDNEQPMQLRIAAPEFRELADAIERQHQAVTLNVQEAFLTYLKVAFIAGLVLASPLVFKELWMFVAAGLYPHERKYVYTYLPMSVFLFAGGAVFCFIAVFPFVLKFLLGFNAMLDVQPQIRLSEWISFAVMLPLMFGVSFQLPMVMLFLERINVFEVIDYREKRRMAILVIAFLSMMLTPADPMSMLLMMFPLIILYEFGIFLCNVRMSKPPLQGGIEPV
jgi:sec-independent protein translocase protein TatC